MCIHISDKEIGPEVRYRRVQPANNFLAIHRSDRMVPTKDTHDLARRLPNSDLIIYPDSGHGAVFQFYAGFVPKALEFLAR